LGYSKVEKSTRVLGLLILGKDRPHVNFWEFTIAALAIFSFTFMVLVISKLTKLTNKPDLTNKQH
jgi:hypothetical protein